MPFPRAGFGLVSLKTGFASDVTNILAIGGIQLNRETVKLRNSPKSNTMGVFMWF